MTINHTSAINYITSCTALHDNVFLKEDMLLLIKEGELKFRHGSITYTVAKHQMIFLRKGIQITYQSSADVSFFIFVLNKELVLEFLKMSKLPQVFNQPSERITVNNSCTRLLNFISSLEYYLQEDKSMSENLVRIKLLELLFCLAKCNVPVFEQVMNLRENHRPDITAVVEENIMNSFSLDQLARKAGRSISSFRRDFLSVYNMPPSQWIRKKRLEKAQELLESTNMMVTDICYTLGFESVSHFSRLFKSQFGYSPSAVRS